MSRYTLQIVDLETGEVVADMQPGHQPEHDFVTDCILRMVTKGVGVLRTSNHVSLDARAAIEEIIFELKSKVRPY